MSKTWCECKCHLYGEYADDADCWCNCDKAAEQQAIKLEYMKAGKE